MEAFNNIWHRYGNSRLETTFPKTDNTRARACAFKAPPRVISFDPRPSSRHPQHSIQLNHPSIKDGFQLLITDPCCLNLIWWWCGNPICHIYALLEARPRRSRPSTLKHDNRSPYYNNSINPLPNLPTKSSLEHVRPNCPRRTCSSCWHALNNIKAKRAACNTWLDSKSLTNWTRRVGLLWRTLGKAHGGKLVGMLLRFAEDFEECYVVRCSSC